MASLVLLPGLMCDQAVWPAQSAGLADLVVSQVIDYGTCDSLAGMAEIALAAAPERFALAAHSMGGRVALEVIRQAPERVTALALLDTGYQVRPADATGEAEKTQRLTLLKIAQEQGMRAMGEQWVQGMVHPDRLSDKPLIEDILRMIARKTPAQFAAQIKALLNRPDGEPVLKTIRCPTLVLCGFEDSWSPLARHQQMTKLIPGSRLIAIEHCGHMSTMERPEAVTEALRGWFTDAAQQAA
jgi:pimeloyl-ACP methyl ester carboxylesterase